MTRLVLVLSLLVLPLLGGCAANYYNVPQETVADQVKALGVVPIIVDTDSDIRHPQKEELFTLLAARNQLQERDLIRLLKNTGSFYSVTLLDADPKAIFSTLLFRRERRDDASIQYNKYFWKPEGLADLIRKNGLDAVMIVVVSGVTRPEKITGSNLLDSLETDYNFLVMTAQILNAEGAILWEYPNFRKRTLSYAPLINLQYPDFDEAKANLNTRVQVKFRTIEGLKRGLEKRRLDLLRRETGEVEIYMNQFEEMTSLMEVDRKSKPAPPTTPVKQPPVRDASKDVKP